MKSIFLAAIGGDLPKLVRLSNAFCMVDGANPFRLEPMKATLPSSKATSTAGARRSSTFLYRSRFISCENTFNTTEEMGEWINCLPFLQVLLSSSASSSGSSSKIELHTAAPQIPVTSLFTISGWLPASSPATSLWVLKRATAMARRCYREPHSLPSIPPFMLLGARARKVKSLRPLNFDHFSSQNCQLQVEVNRSHIVSCYTCWCFLPGPTICLHWRAHSLQTMTNVLNFIKVQKIDIANVSIIM